MAENARAPEDQAAARRQIEALAAFDAVIPAGDLRSVAAWVCQYAPAIELTPDEEVRNEVLLRSLYAIPGLTGDDYHCAQQALLRRLTQGQRDELRTVLEKWRDG